MATACVIELAKGLYGTKPEGAVQDVAMAEGANARPKIDGGARKDASRENALQVRKLVEEFLQALVVVSKYAGAPELKRSYAIYEYRAVK